MSAYLLGIDVWEGSLDIDEQVLLEAKAKLDQLSWSPGRAPGPVAIWQCSADRYKLPGCAGRAFDVNITWLTRAELAAWDERGNTPIRSIKEGSKRWLYLGRKQ